MKFVSALLVALFCFVAMTETVQADVLFRGRVIRDRRVLVVRQAPRVLALPSIYDAGPRVLVVPSGYGAGVSSLSYDPNIAALDAYSGCGGGVAAAVAVRRVRPFVFVRGRVFGY